MPVSAFPTGLSSFGMPIFPSGIPATTGTVYFVSSITGNNNNLGTDPSQPLATINQAFSLCQANHGDMIVGVQGHAETLTGAAAIAANKAGVNVVGLGVGLQRPVLTFASTATTIAVSAANITFQNFRITDSITAVVTHFNITAAGCVLDGVDYFETASMAPLQLVLTTAAAKDLVIQNCSWVESGTATPSTQAWIALVGADRAKIRNTFASLNAFAASASGIIVGATTASLDVEIIGNRFVQVGSTSCVGISLFAGTTGLVGYNHVATAKTAIAGNIALASCYGVNNYSSHVVNKNGLLDPVVDA